MKIAKLIPWLIGGGAAFYFLSRNSESDGAAEGPGPEALSSIINTGPASEGHGSLYVGVGVNVPAVLGLKLKGIESVKDAIRTALPGIVTQVMAQCPGAPRATGAARFQVYERDYGYSIKVYLPVMWGAGRANLGPVRQVVANCIRTVVGNAVPEMKSRIAWSAVERVS